jgi:hypothetical protein
VTHELSLVPLISKYTLQLCQNSTFYALLANHETEKGLTTNNTSIHIADDGILDPPSDGTMGSPI